jgi:two-component system phosphate regulon response regulator PhoB
MVSPTKVFSRQELLDRVWATNIDVETRTVDVHIGRLRKQLKVVSDVELIRTVRGFGYSLDSGLN